jgi:hypothetical protein
MYRLSIPGYFKTLLTLKNWPANIGFGGGHILAFALKKITGVSQPEIKVLLSWHRQVLLLGYGV